MLFRAPRRSLSFVASSLLVAAFFCAAPPAIAQGKATAPSSVDAPLLAYWPFDEDFGRAWADASGAGCEASPERGDARSLESMQGVFGNALCFSGSHMLRATKAPAFGGLKQIAFSAWVFPTQFDTYNEIFRKDDGEQRILFSFQEQGTILSLGLNIDGYIECDAKITPAQLLDSQWHHCAATFDGAFMRVYLDGTEIGSLEHHGAILSGGPAPACIGSANGGECFHGAIDDLRIYSQALTGEEVAGLHANGRDALAGLQENVLAGEPAIDAPILGQWNFNERLASGVIREASDRPELAIATPLLPRRPGVYGNGVVLSGEPRLQVGIAPAFKGLSALSFAAWVKPADISGFREIFRQECDQRLLFAFQEGGAILSLGVNAGGYEECDAPIKPEQVMDGRWHHCAATFDGAFMRVYLDGALVGARERQGALATSTEAPAFIGSSGGTGEFFQGALDDVRVYASALSPDQVAQLYRSGQESLARAYDEQERQLNAFYVASNSFAETLAGARQNAIEKKVRITRDLAEAFSVKIAAQFPEECRQFTEWAGRSPLDYVLAKEPAINENIAGHLVDLLVEYRPLTECQWNKQTPEQLEEWRQADAIERRFNDLKAQGDAARFSPEWIRVAFEAGPNIHFRPSRQEPVAPYNTPSTPSTRDLTAEEAQAALARDWLYQAGGNPSPERIRNEIAWARQLAARIQAAHPGAVTFAEDLAALDALAAKAEALAAPDEALYFQVRAIKRHIQFANPVVDFDSVLFVDMPYPQGSEWPHETRHRLGYMAVPGARLMTLKGLSPTGHLQQLMPQAPFHGSFWRPDLSFDGTKVLFCFKPHNEKTFHLYEINADGTGLTQLTDGKYDDLDPIYLPDEKHIIFSTTRGNTYVRCMPPTNAYPIARCDRDGTNIYLISTANEPDYLPSVMDDGRVIWTRWEYTDKPLWRAQSLWTMHPDGTQVNTFWGNQSVWPDLLKDARSIPGSDRVMFTGSAHHNWFSGSIGIIDPWKGLNFPNGLTKVTADVEWPESGNGPVDPIESPNYHPSGSYAGYYSPCPLSEQDFIVSANRGDKFVLYLMDVDGNRELIYEGAYNILHALPLKARKRPPVLEEQVIWPTREARLNPQDGVIYSANVYQNAPEELRGKAKFLRVLNIEHKTYTYWHKRPYISTGPVVSGVQSDGVKRIIGTVPVESDGSVSFHAPSGLPLHFQLLDENRHALQTMRSFTSVMPGERRGCLGCHERHSKAPSTPAQALALTREPSPITPPPFEDRSVSFARYVRPALDQYCGKCHEGDGKAREKLDLTARPGFLDYDECYWHLTGRPTWATAYKLPEPPPPGFGIADTLMVEAFDTRDPAAYASPKPMTRLSYVSRLIQIASSGKHHGVKVDPVNLERLTLWVDTMCPYLGDEEIRAIPDPEFQGVDWLALRPQIANAPTIIRPGPIDDKG